MKDIDKDKNGQFREHNPHLIELAKSKRVGMRSLEKKARETFGLRLLSLGRDIAYKQMELAEFLGLDGYPSYLDDEVKEIEIMAFEALELDYNDEDLYSLHFDYIHGEITETYFLNMARMRQAYINENRKSEVRNYDREER